LYSPPPPPSFQHPDDGSVKFWQISASSISPDVTDPKPIPCDSPIRSITLQAKDGIAISSDSDGVVRIWNLSTGHCKASFQTPAKGDCLRDVQLIDNRLVLVWCAAKEIHIWDVEKEELLQTVGAPWGDVYDLRISGDGSKVFCMEWDIHAWYIWTGEAMGSVSWKGGAYEIPSWPQTVQELGFTYLEALRGGTLESQIHPQLRNVQNPQTGPI
jgi:WD40 repeat protein